MAWFVPPNASFEDSDLSEWTATGSGSPSIQRAGQPDVESWIDGEWVLEVQKGAGAGGVRCQTQTVEPSTEYKWEIAVYAPQGVVFEVFLSERDADGGEIAWTDNGGETPAAGWNSFQVVHETSALGVGMRCFVRTYEAITFYVDALPAHPPGGAANVMLMGAG